MSDKHPLPLKLGGLYEKIKAQIEANHNSAECMVCIPNNKGGMGGTSVTHVTQVGCGIDWDAKKFFIWPENKMIEAGQEPIKDWKKLASEWATKQMPDGWNIQKATADEVHRYYSWILMFIRDCYSIYPKQQ